MQAERWATSKCPRCPNTLPLPLPPPCSLNDLSWVKIKGGKVAGGLAQPHAVPEQQMEQQHQQSEQQQQLEQTRHHPRRLALGLALPRPKPKPAPVPSPGPRWKAASTQLAGLGLVVHGGDVPSKKAGVQVFSNKTWLLQYPQLRWQLASYDGCNTASRSGSSDGSSSSGGSSGSAPGQGAYPAARRSHSLCSYQVPAFRVGLLCAARAATATLPRCT